MAKLSPLFNFAMDISGIPATGGKLFTYAAGSTTKQNTYTDSTGATPQANPIILNARGEPASPIWLTEGLTYKFVFSPSTDTDPPTAPIRTIDNVTGVNDVEGTADQWIASGITPTYISATQFTLPGDQTSAFHVGRRVKCTVTAGTVYGTIATSAYAALTTIGVTLDSGSLDSGLSAVEYGLLTNTNISLPAIVANSGANTNITSLTALSSINGGQIAGFRNRIINGDFRIDQRNAYATHTITAAAALAYTADRWYAYCTGANVTGRVEAGETLTDKVYRFAGAASVTAIGFGTRLEARDTNDLYSKTVTISANLSNTFLSTVTWTLYRATTTEDLFGTLAAPTVTQIATGSFNVSLSLTRYSAQVSLPAAAITGLQLVLSVGAQTSGAWTIGDVQLELGSVATTFEHRHYGIELGLCQRYYEKSFDIDTAPAQNAGILGASQAMFRLAGAAVNAVYIPAIYKVTKRTTPSSITTYNTSAANAQVRDTNIGGDCTAVAIVGSSDSSFYVTATGNAGSVAVTSIGKIHWTSSAEL